MLIHLRNSCKNILVGLIKVISHNQKFSLRLRGKDKGQLEKDLLVIL
jgi:hypothetical protein